MTYVVAVGKAVTDRIPADFAIQPLFACFISLLGFVAAVSVHDAALLIVNEGNILEFEQNPIGYWLIQANSGSVWLFVVVKLLGTSLVCAVLASIYEYSRRLALVMTSPLAVFQAVLLSYLYTN
jgi:uncharacterized membrane protein